MALQLVGDDELGRLRGYRALQANLSAVVGEVHQISSDPAAGERLEAALGQLHGKLEALAGGAGGLRRQQLEAQLEAERKASEAEERCRAAERERDELETAAERAEAEAAAYKVMVEAGSREGGDRAAAAKPPRTRGEVAVIFYAYLDFFARTPGWVHRGAPVLLQKTMSLQPETQNKENPSKIIVLENLCVLCQCIGVGPPFSRMTSDAMRP